MMFASHAMADTAIRCGTDAFGNAVCMDKDGVVNAVPGQSTERKSAGVAQGKSISASAKADAARSARDVKTDPVRCGTDPFGNTVCR